ncbi:ArnT family glycosyltransferase [Pseudomonas sp. NA-150]|uniref:ArnT family glycosyltransferase n=1 Tax=Pseudomonas sp. NA-150 TaxID=3367525 RepID=UPI0037C8D88C
MSRPAGSLLLIGCLLFFFMLGNHQLQGSTEARVAGIAMAMHLDNDWVIPKLFGEPFLEKPPLSLWLDASAIRIIGASPLAVRLTSAFAALLTMLLLFNFLRRYGRPTAIAWTAAVMLVTMSSYWNNARMVGEDSLLTLGVTLALLSYFLARQQQTTQQPSASSWGLFVLGIAIATLTKGVLGLAMPGVVIFAYLLSESLIDRRFYFGNWWRPGLLTLVGLIPLTVWLSLLYQRAGLEAVGEVLWANSVGRFSGSFTDAGHYEPFYYYLLKLPQAFLPWNILVYLGVWHFRKSLVQNRYRLFFSVWLLAQFTLLTLASSKRTVYLMSLTPAAAVLAAEYGHVLFDRLRERSLDSAFAGTLYQRRRSLTAGVLGSVILAYLAAALWLFPHLDRHLSFLPLMTQIQSLRADGQHVVLYQPNERVAGASVFYTQSQLLILQTPAELTHYLGANPGNVAIMEGAEPPSAPLTVQRIMKVGRCPYYFVGADAGQR